VSSDGKVSPENQMKLKKTTVLSGHHLKMGRDRAKSENEDQFHSMRKNSHGLGGKEGHQYTYVPKNKTIEEE